MLAALNVPADQKGQRELAVSRSSAGNAGGAPNKAKHSSAAKQHAARDALGRPAAIFAVASTLSSTSCSRRTWKKTAYFLFHTQAARFTVIRAVVRSLVQQAYTTVERARVHL